MSPKRRPQSERFWERVVVQDGCWLWQGPPDGDGYGRIVDDQGKHQKAHRLSWQLAGRELPEQMLVHHICEEKLCVNPDHLELMARGQHGDRHLPMQCPKGHPFDVANTYISPGDTRRRCKTCRREASRIRRRRRRAARMNEPI